MDMQNVSNLVVPDGEVRTIHDKDNRLIWGRVNYDTKYVGDTAQDGTPTPDAPIPVQTVTGEQMIKITGKNLLNPSTASSNIILAWVTGDDTPNTGSVTSDYIAVVEGEVLSLNYMAAVFFYDKNKSLIGHFNTQGVVITTSGGGYFDTFTIPSNINASFIRLVFRSVSAGNPSDLTDKDIMVNQGSTVSAFEVYQSQSYTVNLGSTELCKLGTYQDYVYKSGDDWYVHKNCGKVIFNGTENWSLSSNYTNNSRFTCQDVFAKHPSPSPILSNYFTEGVAGTDTQNICVNGSTGKIMVTIANSKATTAPGLTTWLSTHNTTVYYVLTTTTDTKITDAALIAQLDAIHQFLTRYGYEATVSGNIPLIVDKTNL